MHVWTNDVAHFPFAHPYDSNFKPPPVAGTVEMLLDEMDQHAIGYAVLVQVIYYGWDNRYVAHCVKRHPRRFRAQGLIDPTDRRGCRQAGVLDARARPDRHALQPDLLPGS